MFIHPSCFFLQGSLTPVDVPEEPSSTVRVYRKKKSQYITPSDKNKGSNRSTPSKAVSDQAGRFSAWKQSGGLLVILTPACRPAGIAGRGVEVQISMNCLTIDLISNSYSEQNPSLYGCN